MIQDFFFLTGIVINKYCNLAITDLKRKTIPKKSCNKVSKSNVATIWKSIFLFFFVFLFFVFCFFYDSKL